MTAPSRPRGSKGPILWPLVLIVLGIALLLNSFLLLEGFNLLALSPLLLVLLGAVILLRGDFVPHEDTRTFGITRGSVESALLEISAGEIDVAITALDGSERLIAGRYAPQARPALTVEGVHAQLQMDRGSAPWWSFADWEIGLTRELPWSLYFSSHLGEMDIDASGLIVQGGQISTGIGDIRFVPPVEAFDRILLRSTLGTIQVITPLGARVIVQVEPARFSRVHMDGGRYTQQDTNLYTSLDAKADAVPITINVRSSFGDIYLA